jgi:hypothetical protein
MSLHSETVHTLGMDLKKDNVGLGPGHKVIFME